MGTIRKRGEKWTVDYTDGAGQRRRFDVVSKEEAVRELARRTIESGQALPRALLNPNITIREYFGSQGSPTTAATGWMAALGALVKPRTRGLYADLGRLYVLPALGHLKVRQVHRAHIRAFVVTLLENKKLARNTVRTIIGATRSMFSAAVEDGIIMTNPTVGVVKKMKLGRAYDEEDDNIKPFTIEQLARFLAVAQAEEPWFYPLFATMALAGLRLGEALGLKWAGIDRVQREIRVGRTLAPAAKNLTLNDRLGSPKSGAARTVDMNALLVDVLEEAENAARVEAMRRGNGGTLSEFAFTTRMHGVPLDDRRCREVFARVLRRAGLPSHHTPHCLRHTFCALLLAEGVPVTYVMTQAGHSSIDVTVRYYGRWIPKTDRSFIDRINGKLTPARTALVAAGGGTPVADADAGRLNPSQDQGRRGDFPKDLEADPLWPSIHAANFSDSARRSRERSHSAGCPPRRQWRSRRGSNRPRHRPNPI
ncbi:MAG TPA: tyrosine-type recombinase/integrase [Vicinamibacterales bacterium]|nr:tyrosine-type recombinase/integrase [Vicinamibacterales bacterium]